MSQNSTNDKPIIEVQPKDSLPTFEVLGTQWTIPTSSLNTALLFLLCIIKIKEAIESGTKGIKLALTALDRLDVTIIDAMDDLAVEIRETTNADRVVFFLLHNGTANPVYHWKRLSAMSESIRVGVQPVIKHMRDVLVPSIVTEKDYELYKSLKAHKQFVHLHLENPMISRKHKNFMLDTGMFGHYVRVLVDEDSNKPYGAVLIQYTTREQCEIHEGTGWSQQTYDSLEMKLDVLYNLFSKRTDSKNFRIISKIKEFLRFGR
jgi:hypothetical protein